MPDTTSPFDLDSDDAYRRWRDHKLSDYPDQLQQLLVEIDNPLQLTQAEQQAIQQRIRRCNMVIYACRDGGSPDKARIRTLGKRFGLQHLDHNMCADEDAITSLTVQPDALHQGYIPYSNRPIAWHTDGYYNPLDKQILALVLYCVRPAAAGGANDLLDHEIAYIHLRDLNPDYIRALMHPQAMTIPANNSDGEELRPARSGPVFMLLPGGQLHMRYTDRSRSIEWRDDPLTAEAVAALKEFLHTPGRYHFHGTLQPGQGLLSNNVLHTRSGFDDSDQQRLLYRARYFDRIQES